MSTKYSSLFSTELMNFPSIGSGLNFCKKGAIFQLQALHKTVIILVLPFILDLTLIYSSLSKKSALNINCNDWQFLVHFPFLSRFHRQAKYQIHSKFLHLNYFQVNLMIPKLMICFFILLVKWYTEKPRRTFIQRQRNQD